MIERDYLFYFPYLGLKSEQSLHKSSLTSASLPVFDSCENCFWDDRQDQRKEGLALLQYKKKLISRGTKKAPLNTYDQKSWCRERFRGKLSLEVNHCWYIEPQNREKSLTLIWQRLSCLLDEWIAKISKKIFFHGGFSRTPRSPRSNDLETQNDENFIMKSDKN